MGVRQNECQISKELWLDRWNSWNFMLDVTLWNLTFIFSGFHKNFFLVLLQMTYYFIFSPWKMYKRMQYVLNYSRLVQDFCPLHIKITQFPGRFRVNVLQWYSIEVTNQINNQSIIPSTDVIQLTFTLKMTTAQVVETSVTVNNNSPIQDYVHPDDQTQPTLEGTRICYQNCIFQNLIMMTVIILKGKAFYPSIKTKKLSQ